MRYVTLVAIASLLLLSACSGSYETEEYADSNNPDYLIELSLHADEEKGTCEELTVHVKPAPKLYTREAPPSRTVLYDEDCKEPLGFERVRYLEEEDWTYLEGHSEISRFESNYTRMMNDVYAFVWRTLDARN